MKTTYRKKMSLLRRYRLGVLLLLGGLMLMSFTDLHQQSKKVTETFRIDGVGDLNIDNLHGDIYIKRWNQSEIKIEVTIDAKSRNDNAVEKFVQDSEIAFSQDGNHVYAITQLAEVDLKKKWWQWGIDKSSFSINYEVYVPEMVHLELENEHGDIRIESYEGDLDVDLAHGELFTQFITGKTDLNIEHSEVVMRGMSNGKMDLLFSEFEVIRAGNLEINSTRTEIDIEEALDIRAYTKYVEFKIGSMDNFINEGAYDEIKIGSTRYLDINTRFSEISVDVCEVGFNADMYHGEFEIDHISLAFGGGNLKFEHTEVDLVFDGDMVLLIDSKYTDLDLEGMDGPDQDPSDHKDSRFFKGNSQNAKILRTVSRYGSLTLND
ncbi:MAG: hypothetical protein HKN68_16030 [Saprospiraceae bacterium]|nr:hypothetical protein [Saprospiraceae bacterium]